MKQAAWTGSKTLPVQSKEIKKHTVMFVNITHKFSTVLSSKIIHFRWSQVPKHTIMLNFLFGFYRNTILFPLWLVVFQYSSDSIHLCYKGNVNNIFTL